MLDARKVARIARLRAIVRQGRTVQAAAVYRTAYGGLRAEAVGLVLKERGEPDPAVIDEEGIQTIQFVAELDIAIDPRPIAYIALTGGAVDDASLAAAERLEVLRYARVGIVQDRWLLTLRRMR